MLTDDDFLDLFNKSWNSGTVPARWKFGTMISFYKKGKDKKHPSSYIPIKLLEHIISSRLMAHLETNIYSPTQSGYRNTEAQKTNYSHKK